MEKHKSAWVQKSALDWQSPSRVLIIMSLYWESQIVQAITKNVRKMCEYSTWFPDAAEHSGFLQATDSVFTDVRVAGIIKYVHELRLKTQNSLSNWHIQFSMEVLDLETPGVGRLWAGFENSYIAALMCSNGKWHIRQFVRPSQQQWSVQITRILSVHLVSPQ